jgi:hypothetical protein
VMAIPISAAMIMPTTSCHVAHERRSLRPSCPGAGTGSKPSGPTGVPFTISSPRRPLSAPSPNRGRDFDARQDDAPLVGDGRSHLERAPPLERSTESELVGVL